MKIRTMLGLGLIGTALYAHKRHGGEMTIDSFKKSLLSLWKAIQNDAEIVKDKVASTAKSATKKDDVSAYGSGGHTPSGNGTNR
jgi:hypothetical protein